MRGSLLFLFCLVGFLLFRFSVLLFEFELSGYVQLFSLGHKYIHSTTAGLYENIKHVRGVNFLWS